MINTRSFRNYVYPGIAEDHFGGARTMIGNRYKLVIDAQSANPAIELFDLTIDRVEENNLAADHPDIVEKMQKEFREWQQSVLQSLTGADYK